MMSKSAKKVLSYSGAVMCSLGIILMVPLIIHPGGSSQTTAPDDTATVVSFSDGNPNSMSPEETCTIVYQLDGDLIPITETPEYCQSIEIGDKVKI